MAVLIPAIGDPRTVEPANGRAFTVAEMRQLLGGYLELVARLPDGCLAWCNEEGKLLQLPVNRLASAMLAPQLAGTGDYIVGNLLVTTEREAGEEEDDLAEEAGDDGE